jgi:hypothetical protein
MSLPKFPKGSHDVSMKDWDVSLTSRWVPNVFKVFPNMLSKVKIRNNNKEQHREHRNWRCPYILGLGPKTLKP